jgi:hypothetical protein
MSRFWTRLENDAGAFASRLLIEFAQQKLAGSNKIAGNRNAELAALSVRLSLEFEPRRDASREKENSLVEGHMRVAYSVPIHREYMRSGYSSEPILAEAAAEMMKKFDVLAALVDVTSNGLIQKGELGELVGRTLLMRAHDKAIRTEELPQCSSPIPLKAFLVALFGQDATEKIWASEACNIVKSNTFGDEFKDARVHFTHHMRAYRDLTLNDETAYLAMCRGAAWQCAPQHTAVDIGVPVLLRNEKISRRVMTMLWFQIKDRIREGHHIVDVDPEKFFTDPKGDDKRPYIIVIMQLGVKTPKPELTITPPPSRASPRLSHSRHPKFEINVSGCTSNLYNAISASENEQYAQLLAVRDTIEEHSRPETADEVLRLKPFYQSKEASFDWASPKLSALIH